jgi:hypothetical protein
MRNFGFSAFITVAAVLAVAGSLGLAAALTTLVLIAIEITFSFDNAIVNAKVLEKLSPLWRRLFLTIGVVIAIIGMRLLFPILIVMFSAHLSFREVINEALHHSGEYGRHLAQAHDAISAFGGGFLLTLALYFLFDDNRAELWLKKIERPLQKIGGPFWLPPAFVAIIVIVLSSFSSDSSQVLRLGLAGAASYSLLNLAIDGLSKLEPAGAKTYVGWAAFLAFIYLQVLDAAFSFDGVLGAFAISNSVILIAIGLGVGALWVRNLTIFMVKRGTLTAYKYLEHGAHYAILVLAAALLASIFIDVPQAISGIVGLGFIAASFVSSRQTLNSL